MRGNVIARTSTNSVASNPSQMVVRRTLHELYQITTLAHTAAPNALQLRYVPAVNLINTYDRYMVKKIKVHLIPSGTVVNPGAVALAYDPTGTTGVYPDTVRVLGMANSMVAEVSAVKPRVINYVIDNPGSSTNIIDSQVRNPVGTGTPWDAGYLMVGSLNLVQAFSVWVEYDVEFIAPRLL